MNYKLEMTMPEDIDPEGIARALEDAANQARRMSSARAAHSMIFTSCGGEIDGRHGVTRTSGLGTPG